MGRRENRAQDWQVVCPFYKYHTAALIRCEGLVPDTTVGQCFADPPAREAHMRLFCRRAFKNCEHCAALLAYKYTDE